MDDVSYFFRHVWLCHWKKYGAGVAEKIDYPMWMNRDGKECQPSESFGCKVTHHIKYSDICIVGDEVGGKFSQKGNGHISETLYVCKINCTL